MRRSAGITASAVISFGGSALSVVLGILMIVTMMLPRDPGRPAPPAGTTALAIVMFIIFGGFGIWGIISGVGLLRLRNWARIHFAVFGGILSFCSVSAAMGLVVGIRQISQMPETQNVPHGLMTGVFAGMAGIALLFAALGIFWMIYFNRSSVKAQFQGAVVDETPQVPFSIKVIAWFLIVGGVSIPLVLLTRFPVSFFSFVVRGPAGRVVYVLTGIVSLTAGIGILKRRPRAHSLAIGYVAFALMNTLSLLVMPGAAARMESMLQEVGQRQPMSMSTGIFTVPSLLLMSVALWFLITRRRAFIERCRELT